MRRLCLSTLSNCLVTEIRLVNEKCFLTCPYQSPSQTQHELENFCTSLDTLTDHINNELGARNGATKILPIQLVVKLILSHNQLDINQLSTNLPIL